MNTIAMVIAAFISGSLPFSVWISKLLLGVDVRRYGNGNPGAANAFRTGSKLVGLIVLMLDISKAALPVGMAYFNMGIRGAGMVLIALAALLGHVFSPFLRFRGGKALAAALGVWIGLTLWRASLPAIVGALIGIALFTPPGWSAVCAMSTVLLVLLIWLPDPLLLMVWSGMALVLAWTHRLDLVQGIHLRPWLVRLFKR
jgi:glycerol-3-phosphate acyltransferase PlsY